jgi:hypothetical protein
MTGEYEGTKRIRYEIDDETGSAQFVPVCNKCHQFVIPDENIMVMDDHSVVKPCEPNATCSKCGRTSMLFEGYF